MKVRAEMTVDIFDLFTRGFAYGLPLNLGGLAQALSHELRERLEDPGWEVREPDGLDRFTLMYMQEGKPWRSWTARYCAREDVRQALPPAVVQVFDELNRGIYFFEDNRLGGKDGK